MAHKIRSDIGVKRGVRYGLVPGLSSETLAIKVGLAHEEVVVATCYCPPRRAAIPVGDLLKLLNMNNQVYIIGDFNIHSTILQDKKTNKFGKQYNILHRTGKITWKGPNFTTFYGTKGGTTPDKIFANKQAFLNIHAAPGPATPSDHEIMMVKISMAPIQIPILSRRSPRKTDWS